jgi:hypothetical protein
MRYGSIDAFTCDVTSEQRQVCTWVAEQASMGITRIHYAELAAALGVRDDREITRVLREIRERVDEVHEMVQFPIVNTSEPYFEIHPNADYIWDDYRRAECEADQSDFDGDAEAPQTSDAPAYACAV